MTERSFDAIVIGAGPAGEVCAGRLATAGLEVALVESRLVGGECSFFGCMPSKALLRPPELLGEVERVPGAAEAVTGELDVDAVLRRRDEVINGLDDSSQLVWLDERGITLVRGRGRLDGERRVRVTVGVVDELLVARRAVVVAVGSTATIPKIPGLAEVNPWTNHEGTTAKEVPKRLVILGGGVIGVELAQAWSSLGSHVTVVEGEHRLLSREEPFASEHVSDALRERGIELSVGLDATAVRRTEQGVTVELENGTEVAGDELLVAVGRTPLTAELGVETVGLQPGRPIEVDDCMRAAGTDWLYAVGDVNGRALLTHMGKYQARVASNVILGRQGGTASVAAGAAVDGALSPRVVFTDPQLAAVGHTLESAEKAGLHVRAVDAATSGTAGASFVGRNTPGTSRLVVDLDRRVLVGATFTGFEVMDFLHAATNAIVGEVRVERLWHAVPSFPTRSEIWLKLLEELEEIEELGL